MAGLTLYKASAGAGKTFTLAVEYIQLLLTHPSAYRHILAVTFTNKATGEMKERILGQLYGLSHGLPDSRPYLEHLQKKLNWDETKIAGRAGTALRLLIHDYGRFRVETIDSFFQSVMRGLARELELSPNLNIELDTDKVLHEAVAELFRKLEPRSELLRWILDYIDEKIDEDRRWNVLDEISRFGKNLMNEQYMIHGDALRVKLRESGYIDRFRKQLLLLKKELEEGFHSYPTRFYQSLEAASLNPSDLSGKERGIASYFKKLAVCDDLSDAKILNATLARSLEDSESWAAKTSPRRAEIVSLAQSTLIPLLRDAEEYRIQNWSQLVSCRLSLAHLYKVGLLTHIDEEIHAQNYRQNRFLLGETNHLLHRMVQESDPSFVFEKTGTMLHHIMIDEFQDTSRLQWNNFRLLLTEGLSKGQDSLIVGDVKQSIYRWRGGDWEILGSLKNGFGSFPVQGLSLTVNRRSETNVIGFNNFFFTAAAQNLSSRFEAECGYPCEALTEAYSDVRQQSPRSLQKGRVQVTLLPAQAREDYETATLTRLVESIRELSAQGVQPKDMAILLRKKKHIPDIAAWFQKEAPEFRLVSDEAFLLQASVAVCILVVALRSLVWPEDTVSVATLAYQWQTEVKKRNCSLGEICTTTEQNPLTRWLPDGWETLRPILYGVPLHELLERLYRLFDLQELHGQDAYLMTFFDGVDEYLQHGEPSPEAFLRYWEESLCKRAIPAGGVDGIRMLSVHASKGLEFHTVLVPYCDWELESSIHGELVWCAPRQAPFSGLDLIPVSFSKKMADSVYRTEYEHEKLQQWVDNLNLLYVAFTRASANLVVYSKLNAGQSVSGLLQTVLERSSSGAGAEGKEEDIRLVMGLNEEDDGTLVFNCGGTDYLSSTEEAPRTRSASVPAQAKEFPEDTRPRIPENVFTASSTALPVEMVSQESRMEFKQSNRSADFIAESASAEEDLSKEYLNRGQLMHTLFSSIRTKEDLQPALRRLLFEGVIDASQAREAERIALRALNHPDVQPWYNGSLRLYNECTLLYRRDGTVETRRPDRVMEGNGRLQVVDFKFGSPRPEYEEQVREYMDLLRKMGHNQVEGYLWYVYTNQIVQVK